MRFQWSPRLVSRERTPNAAKAIRDGECFNGAPDWYLGKALGWLAQHDGCGQFQWSPRLVSRERNQPSLTTVWELSGFNGAPDWYLGKVVS